MKHRITILLSALVLSFNGLAQSDYVLIEKTLNYYMEGSTNNDFETLAKAFHPTAMMKFVNENGYGEINALEFFQKRMTPGTTLNRKTRIANIDIAGHAANAKLELEYPEFIVIDYMNLLKIDGEWKIVNKIFYRHPMALR